MPVARPLTYWRRGSGPLHISPDGGFLTLCGRKVGQYVATRQVRQRPSAEAVGWCAACLRHEQAGTRRSWRR